MLVVLAQDGGTRRGQHGHKTEALAWQDSLSRLAPAPAELTLPDRACAS